MMLWKRISTLAFVCALLLAVPADAQEETEVATGGVAALLSDAWGTLPKFRDAGDKIYAALPPETANGKEGLFARTLVLIYQRRYEDSLKVVDRLLEKEPEMLEAQRAKIWTLTVLKRHAPALVNAEEMVDTILKNTSAEGTEQRELLEFVGKVVGFLGGPAELSSTIEMRRLSERRIVAKLSEAQKGIFEHARDSVLQRSTELSDVQKAKTDKAKVEHDEAREKTLESIGETREKDADLANRLQTDVQRLDSELQDTLGALDKQDAPLRAQLSSLNSRYQLVASDLLQIENQVGYLQDRLFRERDPVIRGALRAQIDQLVYTSRRIESDLFVIDQGLRDVKSNRVGLANQATQARSTYSRQLAAVESQMKGIAKREKRAGVEETRAKKSNAATPGSALSIASQVNAFATYETYPLEAERSALLKAVR